jgi:hypothetical protein
VDKTEFQANLENNWPVTHGFDFAQVVEPSLTAAAVWLIHTP